ncbi:MAG: PEP-CTERM sorting domain-containing protein [Aquabacterium sp.]|nr:PEP-CTERM sorting domain-containing protein [Aquabacterium sp.]
MPHHALIPALPLPSTPPARRLRHAGLLAGAVWALGLIGALPAQAAVLAQWSFNTDDGLVSTGTLAPDAGSGVLSLVGGATGLFTSGSPLDPAGFPLDSSWSVGGFPAQGTASGTRGFALALPTTGWSGITISFDYRNQPSANKWFAVQASANGGATWADVQTFGVAAADTWYSTSVALSSALPAVDDNPLFAARVVAVFEPGTTAYQASEAGYNGGFGLQIDRLQVSAVPEPGSVALMLAGVAAVGAAARQSVRRGNSAAPSAARRQARRSAGGRRRVPRRSAGRSA